LTLSVYPTPGQATFFSLLPQQTSPRPDWPFRLGFFVMISNANTQRVFNFWIEV